MDQVRFGKFISETRKEQHMTQAQLAEKIGVTDKAVSRWERGIGFPDIQLLEPLSNALGISILELMRAERIQDKQIQSNEADSVLYDTIQTVGYQKQHEQKQERKMIFMTILMIVILSLSILLIDQIGWNVEKILFTGIGIVLPFTCMSASVVFLIISLIRYIQKKPCGQLLVTAMIFAGIVMMLFLILFIPALYAFPPQQ